MREKSFFICLLVSVIALFSCTPKQETKESVYQESAYDLAQEERDLAKNREIYDKYINNQLSTGDTPYDYLYGGNKRCSEWGCSEIKVTTPSSSDVIVLIKKNDEVVRHAYIESSSSYTFQMPNGTYQPFFYYGNGWFPDKILKQTDEGELLGGFVSDEYFSKDYPQDLENSILEYKLILQQSGNFSAKPSSIDEIF